MVRIASATAAGIHVNPGGDTRMANTNVDAPCPDDVAAEPRAVA